MRESMVVLRVRLIALALLALVAGACAGVQQRATPGHTVVLISLDGFSPDYIARHSPPTLLELIADGVSADAMTPSFPSNTFPNHYTLATGLRPVRHGLVHNSMYDPEFDAWFSLRNEGPRESRWFGGEPIWSTAEKQGVRSAAVFWPGTEVEVAGARPSRWMRYDGNMPYDARVDSVLAWLALSRPERPRLITLYFEEPDGTGHRDGPNSPTIRGAVLKADSAIARLVAGLRSRTLYDSVNLVIVSDHGMAEVSPDRVVYLSDVLDTASVQTVTAGSVLMGWSRTGDNSGMVAALRRLPHVQAWLREDIPARFDFNSHRRVTPVVALADEGWTMLPARTSRAPSGGAHGYDNALPSMRAIFIARGPAFRRGVRIPAFENVDVYSLLAHVLGLHPAPTDGSVRSLTAALR